MNNVVHLYPQAPQKRPPVWSIVIVALVTLPWLFMGSLTLYGQWRDSIFRAGYERGVIHGGTYMFHRGHLPSYAWRDAAWKFMDLDKGYLVGYSLDTWITMHEIEAKKKDPDETWPDLPRMRKTYPIIEKVGDIEKFPDGHVLISDWTVSEQEIPPLLDGKIIHSVKAEEVKRWYGPNEIKSFYEPGYEEGCFIKKTSTFGRTRIPPDLSMGRSVLY